jgi:very-short-patch-repair endonuclease
VLDFYCPSKRLSIEVDGDSHFNDEDMIYDKNRTSFLNLQGIRELRFNNQEVMKNTDLVVEKIISILKTTPTPLLEKKGR